MSSSRRLYGQVPYGVQRYTGFPTSVQHRRHLVPITSDLEMYAGKHSSRPDAKYLELSLRVRDRCAASAVWDGLSVIGGRDSANV